MLVAALPSMPQEIDVHGVRLHDDRASACINNVIVEAEPELRALGFKKFKFDTVKIRLEVDAYEVETVVAATRMSCVAKHVNIRILWDHEDESIVFKFFVRNSRGGYALRDHCYSIETATHIARGFLKEEEPKIPGDDFMDTVDPIVVNEDASLYYTQKISTGPQGVRRQFHNFFDDIDIFGFVTIHNNGDVIACNIAEPDVDPWFLARITGILTFYIVTNGDELYPVRMVKKDATSRFKVDKVCHSSAGHKIDLSMLSHRDFYNLKSVIEAFIEKNLS